jgi:hypothetical protein
MAGAFRDVSLARFYGRRRVFAAALAVVIDMVGVSRDARAWSEPAATDLAQARELLAEGLERRGLGDLNGALERLRAAHVLAHTPITGLELGRTYVALGQLVEARETLLSVGRLPVSVDETERSTVARSESEKLAAALRARIPTLLVKITGAPVLSVSVAIDGAAVPTEALVAPRPVNPGTHDVVARSATGETAEAHVEVDENEAREVELKLPFLADHPSAGHDRAFAAPSAATTPVPPPTAVPFARTRRSNAIDWSLIGVGAAVAVAGGVLMTAESMRAGDANDRQDRSAYDSAKAGGQSD